MFNSLILANIENKYKNIYLKTRTETIIFNDYSL